MVLLTAPAFAAAPATPSPGKAPNHPQADGPLLRRVQLFVDTMIARGTDRYGPEKSPLFAAMLNLDTMSLPAIDLPAEVLAKAASAVGLPYPLNTLQLADCGLPPLPIGIRETDRAPMGCNFEHDIMLLRTMQALSAITGEGKYADHVDAYLRFWLDRCQSEATGLMPCGEHMCWDFVHEAAFGNIHEVFRRNPLWDKLYALSPYRAERIAEAMWTSQIYDKKVGDYSRHSGYHAYHTEGQAAYPRHAGFYIWTYANAYVQTRDPKYIARIEVLIESRTGIKPEPFSVLVNQREFRPESSTDPALRLLLWDAAELVPEKRETWRQIVRQLDERAIANELASLPTAGDAQAPAGPGPALVPGGGGRGSMSLRLPKIWRANYGSSGVSGLGLMRFTRFQQTGDAGFLTMAATIAERFVDGGLPVATSDLWPGVCGQVISLCTALSREESLPEQKRKACLAFAQQVAAMADRVFSKSGLFKADGTVEHYEAITGADDLCWAMLQLHCALSGGPVKLSHSDVNW